MGLTRRLMAVALCMAVGGVAFMPAAFGADGAATKPAARPAAAIDADLNAAQQSLQQLVPYPQALGEGKFRKENGEKVIPLLQKMAGLWGEAAAANIPFAARNQLQCLSMAVALGDKEAAKALADMAAGKNAEDTLDLKTWLVLGNWVNASEDATTQRKILEEVNTSAKEVAKTYADLSAERDAFNAANAGKPLDAATQKTVTERDATIAKASDRQDTLANILIVMSQLGPANDDMSKKAIAVIKSSLNSEGAKQAAARAETDQAKKNFVGRLIRMRGRTTVNGNFDMAEWRGKVVLVDFWATWCGPCRDSLPEIKKIYAEYHDKGLEIVGVDSDTDDGRVNDFAKVNKMPWPQLREQTQTDDDNEHPLAKRYGVDAIPTIFLIDRRGVLRYIDGEEDTVNKVKKLIEDVPATQPAPKK